MVMTIRKSGKWIGALGMPVSLVHQIKELVGNTHFLIFDMRLAEGTRIYSTCLGQLGTSKRISQPSKLIFFVVAIWRLLISVKSPKKKCQNIIICKCIRQKVWMKRYFTVKLFPSKKLNKRNEKKKEQFTKTSNVVILVPSRFQYQHNYIHT